MLRTILALLFVCSILGLSSGQAAEIVRVELYHAVNTPPPIGTNVAPEKLHHRLEAVFGFRHYILIKGQNLELINTWEQWVAPRKDFFLRVQPLPLVPGAPRLVDYEIYNNGVRVAKGTFQPHKGTPLFVAGPEYQQGILIFVLEAK